MYERRRYCTYYPEVLGNEEIARKHLNSKWPRLNEDLACKKIMNCTMAEDVRNV
jgi:hypothetical protein